MIDVSSPPASLSTSKTSNNMSNSCNSSKPALNETPEPKQSLLTDWLKDDRKIGSKQDRTLQKRNPLPLLPPCGPVKIQRKLFRMQDTPEDRAKSLEVAQDIKNRPTPAVPVGPTTPTANKKTPTRSFSSSRVSSSSKKPPKPRRSSNPSTPVPKPKPGANASPTGRLFEIVPGLKWKQEVAVKKQGAVAVIKKEDKRHGTQ